MLDWRQQQQQQWGDTSLPSGCSDSQLSASSTGHADNVSCAVHDRWWCTRCDRPFSRDTRHTNTQQLQQQQQQCSLMIALCVPVCRRHGGDRSHWQQATYENLRSHATQQGQGRNLMACTERQTWTELNSTELTFIAVALYASRGQFPPTTPTRLNCCVELSLVGVVGGSWSLVNLTTPFARFLFDNL